MKPHRSHSCAASFLAIAFSLLAGPSPAAQTTNNFGKRDLRTARMAIDEGRWEEGLELYEQLLQSSLARDPELRDEALFRSAAILLATETDEAGRAAATERLEILAGKRGHGRELEVGALRTLLGELDTERSAREALAEQLAAEQQAVVVAREEAGRALAEKDEALASQRKVNQSLHRQNQRQGRRIAALEEALESRDLALAQRDADVDFLTSQLEGTHRDQAQLLDAVIERNEDLRVNERELRATRLALQQKEAELEAQAEALAEKADELRKREEAIREVTDRILSKDKSGQ